ncbi:MAG TPA: ribosome recycling factor [Bacilli bacterium]|jgi:ribosome recycling factor|nr:ribosome recycling factor [Bacilli bacterium]HQC83750.1 ribosome recycling factor [Bacilli bacterium]
MDYLEEAEMEMMDVVENLDKRLITIRAGRANPAMVANIKVEYYGSLSSIKELANITVPEASELFIKPFDKSCLKEMERAINEANLGINPTNNGEMIIMSIPKLTEDTRRQYVKQAREIGEQAKVALRNARQDANNKIKKDEAITEDQEKGMLDDMQTLIDKYNKIVNDKIDEKETELMSV